MGGGDPLNYREARGAVFPATLPDTLGKLTYDEPYLHRRSRTPPLAGIADRRESGSRLKTAPRGKTPLTGLFSSLNVLSAIFFQNIRSED